MHQRPPELGVDRQRGQRGVHRQQVLCGDLAHRLPGVSLDPAQRQPHHPPRVGDEDLVDLGPDDAGAVDVALLAELPVNEDRSVLLPGVGRADHVHHQQHPQPGHHRLPHLRGAAGADDLPPVTALRGAGVQQQPPVVPRLSRQRREIGEDDPRPPHRLLVRGAAASFSDRALVVPGGLHDLLDRAVRPPHRHRRLHRGRGRRRPGQLFGSTRGDPRRRDGQGSHRARPKTVASASVS